MKRELKIIIFVIIVAFVAVGLVIFRYEKLLIEKQAQADEQNTIVGGIPIKKNYTADEIIGHIKSSPNYIGDSIKIFENGSIVSLNGKMNGTIQAVVNSEGNMSMVRNEMKSNQLPLQFNIYNLAASFYRQQYPQEFKTEKDSASASIDK